MDFPDIKKIAKDKLKGYCRVCSVCNGVVCAGEVPGMGGLGTGRAFKANLEALDKYRLNLRTIHEVKEPNASVEIFGYTLDFPVLAAPITGTTYNMGGQMSEEEWAQEVIAGCFEAGTLGMTGDGADPTMYDSGIKAIQAFDGKGIPIIKPRAQEEIIKLIRKGEQANALAVGVDIDGAGLVTMALKGQPVGPKTLMEIKELTASTKLPFILKGVMTVTEAQLAVEAGAAAIVVSNHGGRVLDHTPGAAEVLPEIADAFGKKITIFADGGVRNGIDVLKLLALGANAVLIGRPMITAAFGGGRKGVALYLNKIKNELIQAMLLTGTASLKNVSREIIYNR